MNPGSRITVLNKSTINTKGDYILYWMQAAQRIKFNPALEFAINKANETNSPLLVFFSIIANYPEANIRHYNFMIEGLKELYENLNDKGINIVIQKSSLPKGVIKIAERARLIVCDKGYTRHQRIWREELANCVKCPVIEIETESIVPINLAYPKQAIGARVLRPKIDEFAKEFIKPVRHSSLKNKRKINDFSCLMQKSNDKIISEIKLNNNVTKSIFFKGGYSEAKKHLLFFIEKKLDSYPRFRNDPNRNSTSNLSSYLHFGQISPVEIALNVKKSNSPSQNEFLEELIVRRELAFNFVFFNSKYDSIKGIPPWAYKTLKEHGLDKREVTYTLKQFENASTHDPYWNACQKEMLITGKMHGYMRMYWGKKILEWSNSPENAFKTALFLNNKYELDGRDPNGFTGVSWCFGTHDRPWTDRKIFGYVRYMNEQGLKRKFDANAYVTKIEELEKYFYNSKIYS